MLTALMAGVDSARRRAECVVLRLDFEDSAESVHHDYYVEDCISVFYF